MPTPLTSGLPLFNVHSSLSKSMCRSLCGVCYPLPLANSPLPVLPPLPGKASLTSFSAPSQAGLPATFPEGMLLPHLIDKAIEAP